MKKFPCWVCKGKGSWVELVTDLGEGPIESCAYCNEEGMIEIGGDTHRRIKAEKIAIEIISFSKGKRWEYSYEELLKIGYKALDLVK